MLLKKFQLHICVWAIKRNKEIYDQHGSETNFKQKYSQYFKEQDDEVFDFFDIFASNAYGHRDKYKGKQYTAQRHTNQNQNPQNTNNDKAYQMIPFILILFAIVLWGIGLRSNSNPTYSFTKTDKYKFELETSYHNIKYFVDQNTFDLIRGSQSTTIRIENIVDNDYYQKNSKNLKKLKCINRSV